jgi:hypothetical protein
MQPRDVMELTMRHYLALGEINRAHVAAVDLAPYVHPRLAAMTVEATIDTTPTTLSDAQLEARIRQLRRAGASSRSSTVVH